MRIDQDNRLTRAGSAKGGNRSSSLTRGMLAALAVVAVLLGLMAPIAHAQQIQRVSGYLPAGATKYFWPRVPQNSALDTIYYISGDYHIGGKLEISEGAEVWFLDNSRIVDSAGGKIVANGYAGLPGQTSLNRQILFRGSSEGDTSFEWGHIIVLPNSDSAYFSNIRFTNFRKRNSVDQTPLYNINSDGADAAYNNAINSAMDGVGGVIASFSHKTFIYNAIVDSCRASFAGGAFAFLQSPTGFPNADDGRVSLRNKQVGLLTIRDVKVLNNESSNTGLVQTYALGGAIYMASNSSTYLAADSVTAYLGHNGFVTGVPSLPVSFSTTQDVLLFERCSATNTFTGSNANFAEGGAIYVGSNTALVLSQGTFNNDSAVMPNASLDLNSWGGAIAVSPTSGSPAENSVEQGTAADRLPGLAILKTATFAGCVAGVGGAINMANPSPGVGVMVPRLIVNGDNQVLNFPGFAGPVRDSGLIQFNGNIAYAYGGAIYSPNQVYISGYLAPQNFPWPGGAEAVELRVKFFNNVAGEAGGSIFLDAAGVVGIPGGTPDIHERRAWHLQNSVNPDDPRVGRQQYESSVLGGGAEFVGLRDSTFAVEYNGNTVVGGNGGAINIEDGVAAGNQTPINRFFVDNEFNARNVTVPRDTGSTLTGQPIYSIFPFDPRQLTRFLNNTVTLGPDSANSYNYTPSNPSTARGRGGAIYMLITSTQSDYVPVDSTFLSRVRIEHNQAYSGSAIWCDRYDMKIMSNQSLIANNLSTSTSSATVNLDQTGVANPADPNAGATIWADFEGPLPSFESNSRGDAIYDNHGRYIIRLPISLVNGLSGVDTLRGNYWGNTGPDVVTEENPPTGVEQNTFFIDYYKGCFQNIYEPNSNPPISYQPVTIGELPDTLLMEGRVYDLFDHGTNMKVADYTNRRLAPSEAFSLGEPANIMKMHRYTRDFFDTNSVYKQYVMPNQTDFVGPQPIGYPLFLQADVSLADSNRDDNAKNYTTFFVINQTTNEFVRVNLKETETAETSSDVQQTYRGRLDFVPDSSVAERHPNLRTNTLYTLALLRPTVQTFAEVQRASMLEDSAALRGREYSLSPSDLVPQGDTTDPVFMDCESGGPQGATVWYAGEKYHTLPVRPGDQILVISRTELWKYGPAAAIVNGLQFTIGNVQPPAFVADIPALQSQPYTPNIRFVKRDINYNGSTPATTLLRIAGYDANNFYDPRFLFNPGNYTQLAITATPDMFPGDVLPTGPNVITANAVDSLKNHVRLNSWLTYTTIYNQNITGSNGYVLLGGRPTNPDIVPGGEGVTVTLSNFPPNYASENGLLDSIPGSLLGPDSNALSMWLYPPEMNCERTDTNTTAIGIPDTICIASATATYHFKIIVEDSLPVFDSTHTACGFSYPVAILTDSLRYSVDFNTDVEREDSAAVGVNDSEQTSYKTNVYPKTTNLINYPDWDFRYGRSSYRFVTEPSWIAEPSGGVYVPIDSSDNNFLLYGNVKVRIDSNVAVGGAFTSGGAFSSYLLPFPQNNNSLNLDTILSIESDDGHTGKTLKSLPVTILFAPTFLTTALDSDAREGVDYSQNFNNPGAVKRIQVQNLNPEQPYTYQLLYQGQTQVWYRDFPNKVPQPSSYGPNGQPIYTAPHLVGGAADTVVGKTPNWITIDPYSGVLTGIPGDTDAPRGVGFPCGQDTVTVIVSNGPNSNYCVAAWEQLPLNVDSVNHPPHFVKGPAPLCVMNQTEFCDSVSVYDPDLLRTCTPEVLTLSDTNGFSINIDGDTTSDTIRGTRSNDTVTFLICGSFNGQSGYFNQKPFSPELIKIGVVDAGGLTDTITIPVHLGEQPQFECSICVSNAIDTPAHEIADMQQLAFGAAQDATDSLDQQYCEYELAPIPPASVFDARWILPDDSTGHSYGLNGTTVDVRQSADAIITWQIGFQSGNENGGVGSLYPVTICWSKSCVDSSRLSDVGQPFKGGSFFLRDPQSAQEFDINMATLQGPIDNSLYTLTQVGSDSECLDIRNQGLTNAIIVFVPANSSVNPNSTPQFSIQPNYPNPFPSSTTLNFSVASHSDVRIDIYDVKGTLVRTILNEPLDPGSYPVTWDGTDASGAPAPDGAYIATMTAGSFSGSVKMTLLRGAQ